MEPDIRIISGTAHPELAEEHRVPECDDGPTQKPAAIPPVDLIEKPTGRRRRVSDATVEEKIEDWENRE